MAEKLITDRERFFKNIKKDKNGCWIWQLGKDKDGYGHFQVNGRLWRAPRWAYHEFVRPIPKRLHTDHLCRNPSCVNPDHLEAVTSLENTQRGWRATKLYCLSGHPLFGDNLYIKTDGHRMCKACALRRNQIRYQNNRDELNRRAKKYYRKNRETILARQNNRRRQRALEMQS